LTMTRAVRQLLHTHDSHAHSHRSAPRQVEPSRPRPLQQRGADGAARGPRDGERRGIGRSPGASQARKAGRTSLRTEPIRLCPQVQHHQPVRSFWEAQDSLDSLDRSDSTRMRRPPGRSSTGRPYGRQIEIPTLSHLSIR